MKKRRFALVLLALVIDVVLVLAVMAVVGWLAMGWFAFNAIWSATFPGCSLVAMFASLVVVMGLIDLLAVFVGSGRK